MFFDVFFGSSRVREVGAFIVGLVVFDSLVIVSLVRFWVFGFKVRLEKFGFMVVFKIKWFLFYIY